MRGELVFLLIAVSIAAAVVAVVQIHKHRRRIKVVILNWIDRVILNRLIRIIQAWQGKQGETASKAEGIGPQHQTDEALSKAELERVQEIIEIRKQVARDTDISYHLWNFYINHFRNAHKLSLGNFEQVGEWYDVKILKTDTKNDLTEFTFEMNGVRYKFVDDEETQSWALNVKVFSLFLYDESDRCLIEVPIKVQVDRAGRKYSISPGGPKAFLPGGWTNDFINTKLKHQRMRNQEIRAQKHEERLSEIDDLKDRFGIWE